MVQACKSRRGAFRIGKFDHQAEVPVYIGKVAQGTEPGQPVLDMLEAVPGSKSRPVAQAVLKMRGG